MLQITACETAAQRVEAFELVSELSAWDGVETSKLGFAANDVASFYYEDGAATVLDGVMPPTGELLIGHVDDHPAGCIGYRQLAPGICEMKYLYVRPLYRGNGLGWQLIETLVDRARQAGYSRMHLETVLFMRNAVRMYESLGFIRCAPYYRVCAVGLQRDVSRGDIRLAPPVS